MSRLPALRSLWVLAVALLSAHCATSTQKPDAAVIGALAPQGAVRIVAYAGSPTSLVRDPASGETRGVAVDLGRALAKVLGVPAVFVEFRNNAETMAAMKDGRADFIFTNATPVRARDVDFTPAMLFLEQGYLVPADSQLDSAAAIDRAGVRVGVSRGSTSERELPGLIRRATVVPVASLQDAARMLKDGELDAFATNKAILYELSDHVAGARVLPGMYGREALAIGIPKGRDAALPWLRRFAEDAKAHGDVARAVERAGLRGATVAGPAQ